MRGNHAHVTTVLLLRRHTIGYRQHIGTRIRPRMDSVPPDASFARTLNSSWCGATVPCLPKGDLLPLTEAEPDINCDVERKLLLEMQHDAPLYLPVPYAVSAENALASLLSPSKIDCDKCVRKCHVYHL